MTTQETPRRLEYMDLDTIEPADRNPKQHDKELIEGSVTRFGFIETPVLDERTGKLIAGHGRTDELRARRERGDTPPEGVIVQDGKWLTPVLRGWRSTNDDEAHAAGIALNRIGERGGWDYRELLDVLGDFELKGLDFTGIGFDRDDLDDALAKMQEQTIAFGTDVTFGGGGAHAEPDFNDRAVRYSGKGIRSFVLDYSVEDFDEIAATCARLRRALGCDTNAAVIALLVRERGATLEATDA